MKNKGYEKNSKRRGGYRYDEDGNLLLDHLFKSKWNHTPTKAIRIPQEFCELFKTLAHLADNDDEVYSQLKQYVGFKD